MIECKQTCGKTAWCCSASIRPLFASMPKQQIKDLALLYVWRGLKVYEVIMPEFQGILAIGENEPCQYLSKKGCKVHKTKPAYCKNYPFNEGKLLILPRKCSFASKADIIIENLREIKEEELS